MICSGNPTAKTLSWGATRVISARPMLVRNSAIPTGAAIWKTMKNAWAKNDMMSVSSAGSDRDERQRNQR